MGTKERLQVRVNDELVLDAGTCEDASGPNGPERIIRPPATTLSHQVLAYLREKPDPPKRPTGSRSAARASPLPRWPFDGVRSWR